ncbi:MAG: cation-transporting P-type ATPase, partial [Spirochaetales bacterium]|nr:cation-transporting P-type ATPase [Spirochaetales bacterium]
GRRRWRERNEELAAEGFRMLALAEREAQNADEQDPYRELTLLGLAAMLDPPRQEVREAVDTCQAAGIRVVMVTGDQAATARAVGLAVGLIDREDEPQVEGRELEGLEELSEEERRRLLETPLFYRVSPEQKLRLIELHRSHGSIVAMTGDGVNDAPALKRADIGIAMGRRGQQVAKEAADVILQDDALGTIVAAVEHGRGIFENIRRFVVYLLSGNIGEILTVAAASLLGAPLPLLPLQILYLNAINDVFPALALGMGQADPGIMRQPPRDPEEPILARRHWLSLGAYGALIAVVVLGAFFAAWKLLDLSKTQSVTVSFLSLAFGRLWHVFNMRSPASGLVRNQVVRNPWVWGALGLCSVLILLAVFVPFLRGVLGLGLLPPAAWALLAGASLVPLLVGQSVLALRKAVRAGGGRDDPPAGTAPAARAADKRAHDR